MTDPALPRPRRFVCAARLALVAFVALALLVAWRSGLLAQVADPKTFARTVVGLGAWGYVASVVAYALLQPFGVPGTVFCGGGALPLAVARRVRAVDDGHHGRQRDRLLLRAASWRATGARSACPRGSGSTRPRSAERLHDGLVLRLVLWMPQALHAFLGVSRVPFWTHVWASLLGYALPLFVVSWLGAEMFDASGAMQPKALPVMGAMLAFSIVVVVVWRRWERRNAAAAQPLIRPRLARGEFEA